MPTSLLLVSSDHNTFTQFSSESFRCSLANFRRACTCAFLSRGTLRALQDFSPSRCSVLPIIFLVTMVPAALRSLTRSSGVVLGWFLTVLMIIETPRGKILHGAPDRGRLTVILCFFHLRIIAPTVVTFSPSSLAMVLQPIPALCKAGHTLCDFHPILSRILTPATLFLSRAEFQLCLESFDVQCSFSVQGETRSD